MNTVPRVFAYLRRYPWMALGTLGCAIVSTLMPVVFPAVTKRVIDEVLTQHHAEKLTPLVLVAALAFVLQHGLNSLIVNDSRRNPTRGIHPPPQFSPRLGQTNIVLCDSVGRNINLYTIDLTPILCCNECYM